MLFVSVGWKMEGKLNRRSTILVLPMALKPE